MVKYSTVRGSRGNLISALMNQEGKKLIASVWNKIFAKIEEVMLLD